MLPSSHSQLAKCGHLNHYKKFWIMQTQLEKQDQNPCSSASTSLCLGIAGTANMSTMKESKITSAPLLFNGDINSSAPTSRPEIASAPTYCRSNAFPFCPPPMSHDPARASTSMSYNNNSSLGYSIISNLNSNTQALSLAVNCDSSFNDNCVRSPTNVIQRWASPGNQAHESTHATDVHTAGIISSKTVFKPTQSAQLVSPFSCEPSKCSIIEEKGGEASSSNSSTLQNPSHSCSPINNNEALFPPSERSFAVRSCTLCGTTKTPLWRSGPEGPKSLCNACGIRVKKSRRLQASIEGGSSTPPLQKTFLSSIKSSGRSGKRKFSNDADDDEEVHSKKTMQRREGSSWPPLKVVKASRDSVRTNIAEDGDVSSRYIRSLKHFPRKKGGLPTDESDKVARLLSNRGRLTNVFAKDEEEAAVLLMALSCGLVLS